MLLHESCLILRQVQVQAPVIPLLFSPVFSLFSPVTFSFSHSFHNFFPLPPIFSVFCIFYSNYHQFSLVFSSVFPVFSFFFRQLSRFSPFFSLFSLVTTSFSLVFSSFSSVFFQQETLILFLLTLSVLLYCTLHFSLLAHKHLLPDLVTPFITSISSMKPF